MDDYKKKLGDLASKIKNETPQTPIQKVLPVKPVTIAAVREEARLTTGYPRVLKGR